MTDASAVPFKVPILDTNDKIPTNFFPDGPTRRQQLIYGDDLDTASSGNRRSPSLLFLGDSNTAIFTDALALKFGMSFPTLVAMLSRGRILMARNAGVPSDTSRMILARLQADVLDHKPGRVFLQAGSNDTTKDDPNTSTHFEDARIAYREIVERCLAAGIEVIIGTIPPRGSLRVNGTYADSQVHRFTLIWNVFLRQIASEYRLPLVDTYRAVTNPTTEHWDTGLTGDNVHFSQNGALAAARYIVEQLLPLFPTDVVPLTRNRYDVLNFCQDPLFLGAFTYGTGGRFPQGFNGSSAAVLALSTADPAAGDGLTAGKWLKASMTGSTSAQLNMIRTLASMRTSSGLDVKAGDRVAVAFPFRIDTLTGSTPYVTISVSFRDSSGAALKTVTIANQFRLAFAGTAYVEELIPAGTVDVRLDIGKPATADTADVWLGQVTIYDLTAMGLGSLLVGQDQGLIPVAPLAPVVPVVVTETTPTPETPTAAPGAAITSDSFDRADTAAGTLGVTDNALGGSGARTWTQATQSQILSNAVGGTTTTTRYPGITLDSPMTDGRVSARIPTSSAVLSGGVWLRGTDAATPLCYVAYVTATGGLQIAKIEAGSTTSIGAASADGSVKLGDKISLSAIGTTLTGYVNDVAVVTRTDSTYASGTRAGLRISTNSDARRLDDFIVNAS
jgi:lysophospholipase L1-like esterase